MKGVWNNGEVISLFKVVEEKKEKGEGLRKAFEEHAKKYNRKPNSVRNYYYQEVDKLGRDEKRAAKLKLDLTKHIKNRSKSFSKQEEEALICKIEKLLGQGRSVRSACCQLAKGNKAKMLRFQNKYRNYKHSLQGGKMEEGKIIQFSSSKKQLLTESDITSLFMGLVRLVKKNIASEFENKQNQEKESLQQKLRKTITTLGEREGEISSLKEKFEKLKKENQMLSQKMMKLKCEKASMLSKKLSASKVKASINV